MLTSYSFYVCPYSFMTLFMLGKSMNQYSIQSSSLRARSFCSNTLSSIIHFRSDDILTKITEPIPLRKDPFRQKSIIVATRAKKLVIVAVEKMEKF